VRQNYHERIALAPAKAQTRPARRWRRVDNSLSFSCDPGPQFVEDAAQILQRQRGPSEMVALPRVRSARTSSRRG